MMGSPIRQTVGVSPAKPGDYLVYLAGKGKSKAILATVRSLKSKLYFGILKGNVGW